MTCRYVAFLRGINVGGRVIIKMDALREVLKAHGYANIRTILASGNVLFDTNPAEPELIAAEIERVLAKHFGREIGVIVRTLTEIQELVVDNPFAKIRVTPQTRLYVTFLSEKRTGKFKTPYQTPKGDFAILRVTIGEVISVVTLSEQARTTDAMKILETNFGRKITTRNWKTIQKIARA